MGIQMGQKGFNMDAELNSNIRKSILAKYKSLENPDFSFVRKMDRSRPYNSMIKDISANFHVEDHTDINDDVCFSYNISNQCGEWGLELSMIGLYAVVLLVDKHGACEPLEKPNSEFEREIFSKLNKNSFQVLGQEILETPLKINLFNTDSNETCFYQALFSDVDILPWKACAVH